jgi:hypothetical protein
MFRRCAFFIKKAGGFMKRVIYCLTIIRSRKALKQKYGKKFWRGFKKRSKEKLNAVLPLVPDIGKSIFSFNYQFGPPYIAWYKTFLELGLQQQEAWETIWLMNERMVTVIPRFLLHFAGKAYFNGFRKKAAAHVSRQEQNLLHPYDWRITYREIDKNTFEIDITECAMKKLAHAFEADGLLPGICRMDHLFSHLMGNGFERTKTLGDGDDCCNCRYLVEGACEWSPEKGFETRK